MKAISIKGLWGALLAAGLLSAGAFALAGSASAGVSEVTPPATIRATLSNGNLAFKGPDTVAAGSILRIRNNTNPEQVGPHTFTLTKKHLIPKTRAEMRKCGQLKLRICRRIVKAHRVNFETFEIGRPVVERREVGWDRLFGAEHPGDSWLMQEAGESHQRVVSAEPGKVLPFFCVVHPDMQGKIRVTAPAAAE